MRARGLSANRFQAKDPKINPKVSNLRTVQKPNTDPAKTENRKEKTHKLKRQNTSRIFF